MAYRIYKPTTRPETPFGEVNPGWSRARWIDRLRQLAATCEPHHPDRAAELRRWADEIILRENIERPAG